jgi:two-component system chemotaxis sensor kinase CheA
MSATLEQAILELSAQGIFTFDQDFRILPGISTECQRIFGRDITGENAAELLFGKGDTAQEFEQGIALVLTGNTLPEVVFDLLEPELERAGRRFRIDYRLLPGSRLLVMLTDITRERRFQEISKRDLERRFVVLKAVTHRRYFASLLTEAGQLFEDLSHFESAPPRRDELASLGRQVHTFKGNAAFFDFQATAAAAHGFESHLEEAAVFNHAPNVREHSLAVKKAYFPELRQVTDLLGERWLSEADGVSIPRRDFLTLEKWIRVHHPADLKLARAFQGYRREPFRELFIRFPEMAAGLAAKLGKRIHPLMIEGGDFHVIPDRYQRLMDVLVHLVRNALDHGVEPPAERERAGKQPAGSLRIKLARTPVHIDIAVSDDGRGIDPAAVAERARALGLAGAGGALPEAQAMQFLFHQGFSTATETTEISGRGIGLAAVKAEIDRMGGRIQIHSRPGRGSTFEITLPLGRKRAT